MLRSQHPSKKTAIQLAYGATKPTSSWKPFSVRNWMEQTNYYLNVLAYIFQKLWKTLSYIKIIDTE